MKQKLFYLFSLLSMVFGSAWAQDVTTVTYALQEDETFTSGQEVSVTNDAGEVVATIVFGEEGGNAFTAAVAESSVDGFSAYTAGNGENGNKPGGTFYTIKPLADGTIDVAVVLNADKGFYIQEDGVAMENFNGITVTQKYYGTYTFQVKAGSSYKVYCSGSKLGFYGFKYNIGAVIEEDEPIVDPTDEPTESESLLSYTIVEGDENFATEIDLVAGNGFVQFAADKRESRENGTLYGFKADGNVGGSKYMLLKPSRALQVGDKISLTMFAASNPDGTNYGLSFYSENVEGAEPLATLYLPPKAKNTLHTGTYTVVEGDGFEGLNEIYVFRAFGMSTYIVSAEIVGASQGGEDPTPGVSKTWNFSNWEAKSFEETETIDGLTVVVSDSTKPITIDGSNKTYDGVSYTQRLKFGGAGSATNRHLTFELPANTSVKIIATHASSSGDPRPLKLATGQFGSEVASVDCPTGEVVELNYTNKGAATTAFIYSGNSGINLYAIYLTPASDEEETVDVEISSVGYATLYYSDKALVVPERVSAFTIIGINEQQIQRGTVYETGQTIPAGEAVVLEGVTGSYQFVIDAESTAQPTAENMLKGSDEAAETTGEGKFYKLTVKKINGEDLVGFYFGAADGAAFTNAAHKAYLVVDDAVDAKFFLLDGEATGINTIAKFANDGQVYNLQGVRMNGEKLTKGIYVVNGKKVVIK